VSGVVDKEVGMGLVGSVNECRGSRKISFGQFSGSQSNIQVVIQSGGPYASLELNGVPVSSLGGIVIDTVKGLIPEYLSVSIPNAALSAANELEADQNFTASQEIGRAH